MKPPEKTREQMIKEVESVAVNGRLPLIDYLRIVSGEKEEDIIDVFTGGYSRRRYGRCEGAMIFWTNSDWQTYHGKLREDRSPDTIRTFLTREQVAALRRARVPRFLRSDLSSAEATAVLGQLRSEMEV